MQALQTLRVYTNVPQVYSQTMKHGMKVGITFPEYPGKSFEGTLVRTAEAIDPVSRTLLVELDVDNRSGQLMPGSQAEVHFKTSAASSTYIVPASALIFRREGIQLSIVTSSGAGTVAHLIPVLIGEDDGATVEIVSGLNPSDRVIQDPPDSLIDGEKVTLESTQSSAFGAGGL
jgi:RND family efflux transporter MFP subunit